MEYCIGKHVIDNVEMVCFDEKTKGYYSEALKDFLIKRLIFICTPENRDKCNNETELISIINSIAYVYGWKSLGNYGKYIEMSGRAIDNNAEMVDLLDLNTTIATLICILREQYWDGGWSDTIGPRISNRQMIKLVYRLMELG